MIVISKDKIHHEYFDGQFKVMVDISTTDSNLTKYLSEVVHVEEGVTVEDVFLHLRDYQEDIGFTMESSLGGYPLELYLDELLTVKPEEEHLIYIEFCHEVSVTNGTLTDTTRFGAIGLDITGESPDEVIYSIELAPIYTYKHLPIVLNKEFRIINVDENDIESVLVILNKEFTLYDLLHSMLFEISYYGTPEMRAECLKTVIASMGQSGEQPMSMAQVEQMKQSEISRLNEELKHSIASEDYERSAIIRDQISQLKRDKSENDSGTNR